MIESINLLENANIEKIIGGGSNGSIILIDLIQAQKKYILYIYCAWRLSANNKVLTGWNDESTSENSTFITQLKKLEGDFISKVNTNTLGDFSFVFKSGKKLDVFCDVTSNNENDDIQENWSFCNIETNKCYNFTNYFNITEESYS